MYRSPRTGSTRPPLLLTFAASLIRRAGAASRDEMTGPDAKTVTCSTFSIASASFFVAHSRFHRCFSIPLQTSHFAHSTLPHLPHQTDLNSSILSKWVSPRVRFPDTVRTSSVVSRFSRKPATPIVPARTPECCHLEKRNPQGDEPCGFLLLKRPCARTGRFATKKKRAAT